MIRQQVQQVSFRLVGLVQIKNLLDQILQSIDLAVLFREIADVGFGSDL